MNKHDDRRSSLRRPIHHEAVMKVNEDLILNCIIADYCLGGMFIKFMSESANRLLDLPDTDDENIRIELTFKGEKEKVYSVDAEIVHHVKDSCGIHFIKRFDQAVQSLVNLSVNTGISSDNSLSTKTILNECIHFIDKTFGSLLGDFWAALEKDLRANAVKASNDQSANSLMALAGKIKQRQVALQSAVMNGIKDPVSALNIHLEKRKVMSERLSIIDKNEFEDWLVSRVLVIRCESDYQSLLMSLKLRLDALGVGDKRHHQSVFGPALLVSAFQPVVQSLIVDSSTEKLIFRVFEKEVMLLLKGLYEGLNAILIRHNILPKLNVKRDSLTKNARGKKTPHKVKNAKSDIEETKPIAGKTKSVAGVFQKSHSQNTVSQTGLNSGGDIPSTFETSRAFTLPPFSSSIQASSSSNSFSENQQKAQSALSNISNLLRSLRSETPQNASVELQDSYTTEEFDQGLFELQTISAASTLDESPKSLIERVRDNLLQSGEEKEIDDIKQAAIDVVDRFFLSMRNNPRISSEAKQYLLKLEVPVLKVLLKDDRFFEDQQSSVRAVMNRIAQLGAKGSKLNPASRDKVSQLVQKIILEFESDTAIFDTVLAELDQIIDRQNNLYVKNVERVAAAAEGSHKVEDANLAVTNAINERIAHKFVPSALVTLINEGWKEYLHLAHIKYGEESEQWNEALSVIDRLIAYGDDPRMPIDIKVILPKIQEGLKLVSGNNEASVKVRDALKAFILNAPKGLHLSEKAQQLIIPESEDDLLNRNIHKSHELKNWIIKIKSIPLGAWMKFNKQENETTYMRLVWVAKGFSKFVFVNHQGMKVVELGLFKLANYLKGGRIQVDKDYELPIVNQGLDDMVKDVYDKLAYESSHDIRTGLINKSEFCRQVRITMKKGKRTSACSLLYIHFRAESDKEFKLSELFADQVVKTLEESSGSDAILGRVSETDFVIFNVVSDPVSYRAESQSALIGLCQRPENIELGLIVTVGESRAHLGFNNPESMILHASDAINISSSSIDEPKTPKHEKSKDNSTDKFISDVIVIDEAANAELNAKEFTNLTFDIWGQSVTEIVQETSENENSPAKLTLNSAVQLNLLCAIQGDDKTYLPENEECATQFDEWWVQKLMHLQKLESQLFEGFQKIRVNLSAFAFNKDDMIETLVSYGHSGKLNASKICFDVYDCFQIEDVELAAMRMNRLKNMGYSFCLDNFGSDRSPFSYLKALPVDMIKIDDVFIAALNQNEGEAEGDVAADSIVEIAHYLGKKVLAAEVDSAVCLQKMKHLKVDFVQGTTIAEIEKYDI
jgi:EAL domain-containing protein (putative c-di-GMP-specific phosphodiesterase class I)